MTGTADITDQERDTLRKGVTGAGMLVAVSDKSFFDSFKEAGAIAKHLAGARESESELVRELAQGAGTGFGLSSSPAEIERETLDALRASVSLLQNKAPADVDAYKNLVLDVAQSVGNAAGGGETTESEAIEKIRSTLEAGATA
jgi:tellurite resistance protein